MAPSPKTTPPQTTRASASKTATPSQVPTVKTTVPEDDDEIQWDDGEELVDPSEAQETKAAAPVTFPKDASHDPTAGSVSETKPDASKLFDRKPFKDFYKDNIKSEFSQQKETNDPDEIVKQLEFYFHESNLSTDKYLFGLVDGVNNKPVPLATLHSFKRMRRFQPLSAIIDAIKTKSTMLNIVDDDTAIQRKEALPQEYADGDFSRIPSVYEDKAMAKSIYAKGFGAETRDTQLAIEEFFKPFGPVTAVRLRRRYDKFFKGSVFVEFDTEDLQKAFLELDPKPKWSGKEELKIMSKKAYCDLKRDEMQNDKEENPEKYIQIASGDWKLRREHDQKNGFQDRRSRGRAGRNDRGGGRGRGGRGGRGRHDGGGRGGGERHKDRGGHERNGSRHRGRERYVKSSIRDF